MPRRTPPQQRELKHDPRRTPPSEEVALVRELRKLGPRKQPKRAPTM